MRLLDNMFAEVRGAPTLRASTLLQGLKTIYRFGLTLVERWRRANKLFDGKCVRSCRAHQEPRGAQRAGDR